MRIIEWNCQGAFRQKNKEILEFKPDILIIPECEQEHKLHFGRLTPKPNDFIWYGDTDKKGIAIFSYSNFKFRLLKEVNPNFRYIVPLEVTDGRKSFLLFAVWAMDNKQNPLASYIGQVWNAVNYYQTILHDNSILIGDFNSNQIWDEKDRVGNHTDVVNLLKQYDIESLYHKQFNEEHGKESLKTFFMYRNVEKPYHIDYVFASKNIIQNGYKLTLETSEKWIDKSDHIPLILEVNPFESKIASKDTYSDIASRQLKCLSDDTKNKFSIELSNIENLAKSLDDENNKDGLLKLISDIEILKQIDKLIAQLTQNGC
ncbi:MAG: endonuclease/exonuclease/phosphatase family protein [Chitinophagaceae bacterium]|nr:endonuclease/exonuclease/phosphatase family protein [Chitinophagaceae bacterium]